MSTYKPFRFKFFLPEARVLSDAEIETLAAAKAAGTQDGLWLEIRCPDASCLDDDGRITLPPQTREKEGFFLNLFCPRDSCEVVQGTDLP